MNTFSKKQENAIKATLKALLPNLSVNEQIITFKTNTCYVVVFPTHLTLMPPTEEASLQAAGLEWKSNNAFTNKKGQFRSQSLHISLPEYFVSDRTARNETGIDGLSFDY
jgi:hypothetical protein